MPENPAIAAHATQLVPSLILLFDGLKRAYAARNEEAGLPDLILDAFIFGPKCCIIMERYIFCEPLWWGGGVVVVEEVVAEGRGMKRGGGRGQG